jgi:hypothetical protein
VLHAVAVCPIQKKTGSHMIKCPWEVAMRNKNHTVPSLLTKSWGDENKKLYHYNKVDPRHGIRYVTPRGAFWEWRIYVEESEATNAKGQTEFRYPSHEQGKSIEGFETIKARPARFIS